jgi:hypothetical protein
MSGGLDLDDLLAAIDDRLGQLTADPVAAPTDAPRLRRTEP